MNLMKRMHRLNKKNSNDEDIQKEQQAELEKRLKDDERKKDLAKEKEVLDQLTEIYKKCEEINDNELVDKVNEIEKRTEKIDEKLKHIIAKRIAVLCMEVGSGKLPTLMQIMPATDMLEANLPVLVEKEYQKLTIDYDEQGKEYRPYGKEQKEELKKKLLENIARKVAENFEEIGDISVPQIEPLRELKEEEINVFINAVKIYCHKEKIGENDIDRIKRQLKGDEVEEWENLKRILEKMKPKDREIAVRDFMKLLKAKEKKTEAQKELDEVIADIYIHIKKLPNDKRLSTAKMILNVLEEQQQAINMCQKHKVSGDVVHKETNRAKEEGTSVGENR